MSTKLKIVVAVLITMFVTSGGWMGFAMALGAYINKYEPLPTCQPPRALRPSSFSDYSTTG
jgi:hypothetical protein